MSIEQLNSIFLDFGMQLLKNDTVKQHENHPSGTWGDAEQESWWSLSENNLDLFFMNF